MSTASDKSRMTLESLRGFYAGKRAFILGNGPSLKSMDLSKLRDEVTFGTNGLFYLFDGGRPIPDPLDDCCGDPTPDTLSCDAFSACP